MGVPLFAASFFMYICSLETVLAGFVLPSVDTAPVSQRIGSVAVRTDRAAKEHQVDSKEKADQRNEGQQYHERAVVKVMQTSDVQRQAAERGDKGQSKGQYLEHRSVWRKQTADQIA